MNARIVNLRTRRKQKARDGKRKAAADAPAAGVSKLERARAEAENRRAGERLEGHHLERAPAGGVGNRSADDTTDDAG